jgi:hypothetical protein
LFEWGKRMARWAKGKSACFQQLKTFSRVYSHCTVSDVAQHQDSFSTRNEFFRSIRSTRVLVKFNWNFGLVEPFLYLVRHSDKTLLIIHLKSQEIFRLSWITSNSHMNNQLITMNSHIDATDQLCKQLLSLLNSIVNLFLGFLWAVNAWALWEFQLSGFAWTLIELNRSRFEFPWEFCLTFGDFSNRKFPSLLMVLQIYSISIFIIFRFSLTSPPVANNNKT